MGSASEPVVILCGCDQNFTLPLAVTLYSAVAHLDPACAAVIHVIETGLSDTDRARIERAVQAAQEAREAREARDAPEARGRGLEKGGEPVCLHWHRGDLSHQPNLPRHWYLTQAALFRLLAPRLLPDVAKIIYLDSDLLVRGDLAPLWAMPIEGKSVLAARDFLFPTIELGFGEITSYRGFGLPPDAPYFNSGVLVMNLQDWRRKGTAERCFDYLATHPVRLMDQDALNILCAGRWGALEPAWNAQMFCLMNPRKMTFAPFAAEVTAQRGALLRGARVYHLTGTKPWKAGIFHPLRRAYFHDLAASGFFTREEFRAWQRQWWMRNLRRAPSVLAKKLFGRRRRRDFAEPAADALQDVTNFVRP